MSDYRIGVQKAVEAVKERMADGSPVASTRIVADLADGSQLRASYVRAALLQLRETGHIQISDGGTVMLRGEFDPDGRRW